MKLTIVKTPNGTHLVDDLHEIKDILEFNINYSQDLIPLNQLNGRTTHISGRERRILTLTIHLDSFDYVDAKSIEDYIVNKKIDKL